MNKEQQKTLKHAIEELSQHEFEITNEILTHIDDTTSIEDIEWFEKIIIHLPEPEPKEEKATPKQMEVMSYTGSIAYLLHAENEPTRIRDIFDILIHKIPDDKLDKITKIFQQIQEEPYKKRF